jgi:predicted Zn-dependent peptidase
MRGLRWVVGLSVWVAFLMGCIRPEPALHLHSMQAMFQLGRGYRFAALPEPSASVVWVDVRYPVGSADDPSGKPGLAHLVEHLLFDVEIEREGRKTSIDAELRGIALARNAFTTEDTTTFRTLINPRELDRLLALEADRLAVGCAGLSPEVFAREREVVLDELRARSAGATPVQQVILDVAYPSGHPYRTRGSEASVRKLELADACAFLAGPYRRGQAIIVASGAVDKARLARAAHAFDRLPARLAIPPASLPAVALFPDVSRHPLAIRDSFVIALWPLPPRSSRVFRMLELAWWQLPSAIASAHPGYASTARIIGGARAPVLMVALRLPSTSEAFTAIDAVKQAVSDVQRSVGDEYTPPSPEVWKRQAALLLADWDSLATRCELFEDYLAFEPGTDFLAERMAELSKVIPPDVDAQARRGLAADRARFLVIEATGSPLASPAEPPPEEDHHPAEAEVDTGGREASYEAHVDLASADQPLPRPDRRPWPRAERRRLSNGLSVVLWPHGTTPLVRGALVVHSGWAHELLGQEGITQLFADDGFVTPDHFVFGTAPELVSRSDDLVRGLAKVLRYPYLHLRSGVTAILRDGLRKNLAAAEYVLDRRIALYGVNHPYARLTMTEGTLAAISDTAISRWSEQHMVANNATLVLAGKFDLDQLQTDITDTTDLVRSGNRSHDVDDQPRSSQAWLSSKVADPGAQTRFDIEFVGGRGIDADHAKRLVLEEVLDQKVFELRTRHALAYYVGASYVPRRAGGLWSITAVVEPERTVEASAALVRVLDQLRHDAESYRAAFVLARQKVIERLLASQGSSAQALGRLIQIARFDLDESSDDRIASEVAALTLASFHPFVSRELAEAHQVFGVIGESSVVDAALDAARHASGTAGAP